ncbi:hypothetical protein [Actinoplanes sp. NPDC051851]|uniref:hypothetical protein n=1 Tax=Actinoplanes sp. NPDC051851 TaxID=3154753 RepID=UPI003445C435
MDELDRLLAETMHDAAGRAPSEAGLLGTVHDRSRRYHRRRVAGIAGVTAAALLVAAVPLVAALTARPHAVTPPAAPAVSAPASPSARRISLTDGWTAPAFPYELPAVAGLSDPIASVDAGSVSAFFEATELRDHADVTVTVAGAEPAPPEGATAETMTVRGHTGTLRTVDVAPAKQLTLTWRESAGEWMLLATDDTYTPEEVVALADSLTGASIAVLPPFDLEFSPNGLITDTVSASRMTFRAPGTSTAGFRTVLREHHKINNPDQKISGYDATLTRTAQKVTLEVDVDDWDAVLEITVDDGLDITDGDLIRYAAGVTILNRSDPE